MTDKQKVEKRGGARSNAGRKKGGRNKLTAEQVEKAKAGGIMPLDYMLEVMRTPEFTKKGVETQASKRRRYDAAKDCAPYCHPKLATVEQKHTFDWSKVPLEQLKQVERILAAAAGESSAFPDQPGGDPEANSGG